MIQLMWKYVQKCLIEWLHLTIHDTVWLVQMKEVYVVISWSYECPVVSSYFPLISIVYFMVWISFEDCRTERTPNPHCLWYNQFPQRGTFCFHVILTLPSCLTFCGWLLKLINKAPIKIQKNVNKKRNCSQ